MLADVSIHFITLGATVLCTKSEDGDNLHAVVGVDGSMPKPMANQAKLGAIQQLHAQEGHTCSSGKDSILDGG
jgi:hypothetical protein